MGKLGHQEAELASVGHSRFWPLRGCLHLCDILVMIVVPSTVVVRTASIHSVDTYWGQSDITQMAAWETQASVSLQRSTIRYLLTETALGELWSLFKKLRQYSEIKDLKTTAQEKKEDSFIFPASSCPQNWPCSLPRGNSPDEKNSPHQERESGVSD